MPETPQVDPALLGSGPRPVASATAVPLTRAELRRRAQAEALTAAPLTRRQARQHVVVVDEDAAVLPDVPVDTLPDLAPDALELPDLPDEVPVVVETAAAAVATSPIVLPAGPAGDAPAADDPATAGPDVDEFAAAAKLFAFTGETPVQVAAAALAADDEVPDGDTPARRTFSFKRAAAASFSVGVIGAVGLLTVGMTVPMEAVAAANGRAAVASITAPGDLAPAAEEEIQAYVAPADVAASEVQRSDDYETSTFAELAAESGISNFSNFFVNDPTSAIQWPFAVGVPITYGFGMRSGTMHEGIDFVPGAGSPIQAIADGTVRIATESGGAFGVTVVIDHVIDGELISSRYAHMQYGSLQVEAGDIVTVGTFLGRTGNTGRSYGAHTHFELLAGGTTAIDPLPWLREHAGG